MKLKSNSSRLFQLAINDTIKSNAQHLERYTNFYLNKINPPPDDPSQSVASKPKVKLKVSPDFTQQRPSTPFQPQFKDPDRSSHGPPSNGIPDSQTVSLSKDRDCQPFSLSIEGDYRPVSLSNNSCDVSLPSKSSTCASTKYDHGLMSDSDDCQPKWIGPPRPKQSSFCDSKDSFGCSEGLKSGTFSYDHLIDSNCEDQPSEDCEPKLQDWSLPKELDCAAIPAPKAIEEFFTSPVYDDQIKSVSCQNVIPRPKSYNSFSDTVSFEDRIYAKVTIPSPKSSSSKNAIPTPRSVSSLSDNFSFGDGMDSANQVFAIPGSKNFATVPNLFPIANLTLPVNCETSIPSLKKTNCVSNSFSVAGNIYKTKQLSPTSYNNILRCNVSQNRIQRTSFDYFCSDQTSSLNTVTTIPSPNSYNNRPGFVSLEDKDSAGNLNRTVISKQFGNGQSSSGMAPKSSGCGTPTSSLKQSRQQNSTNLGNVKNDISQDFYKTEHQDNSCDNLFPNDYLDELIKLGSASSNIPIDELDYIEDTFLETDVEPLNFHRSPKFPELKNGTEIKSSETFNWKKQYPSSSYKTTRMADFNKTPIYPKSGIKLNDSKHCKMKSVDKIMSLSISPPIPNPHGNLGARPKIKSESGCKINTSIVLSQNLDQTNKLANNQKSFETTYNNIKKSGNICFTDTKPYKYLETKPKLKSENLINGSKSKTTIDLFQDPRYPDTKFGGNRNSIGAKDIFHVSESFQSKPEEKFKDVVGYLRRGFKNSKSTSLDSLIGNSSDDTIDLLDHISVNSYSSTTNELNSSNKNSDLFSSDVFFNESNPKNLSDCNNALKGRKFGKNMFLSKPSTSVDSGLGFLQEDSSCSMTSGKGSEAELYVLSFAPEHKKSELDKTKMISDSESKYSISAQISECGEERENFLSDRKRIDNLIDQFIGI